MSGKRKVIFSREVMPIKLWKVSLENHPLKTVASRWQQGACVTVSGFGRHLSEDKGLEESESHVRDIA